MPAPLVVSPNGAVVPWWTPLAAFAIHELGRIVGQLLARWTKKTSAT